ncbi:MAG: hypothetical protein ACUVUG_06835 [Candidatus Aminicenantia bacterium]
MKEPIFIIPIVERGKNSAPFFMKEILGRPIIHYTIELAKAMAFKKLVFLFRGESDYFREILKEEAEIIFVRDNISIYEAFFSNSKIKDFEDMEFIVLRWEYPLLTLKTLRYLYSEHLKRGNSLTLLSSPTDSSNTGIFVFSSKIIPFISISESKKDGVTLDYLRKILEDKGEKVGEVPIRSQEESIFLKKRNELPKVIQILRTRKSKELQAKGVIILDPSTTWIDFDVKIGKETVIYPFTLIEGETEIGKRCVIYPFCHIKDSFVSNNVQILTSSFIDGAKIMKYASIGPYSRIRPNTLIESKAKIGNFVEVKNTVVGKKSKALHLTYLGDAKIGSDVNVGAGTITCNFDGKNKNTTIIESRAFIGSGTELVAPVKVGKRSYIGAGSTITRDVPPYALGIARERQTNIENWVKRRKK